MKRVRIGTPEGGAFYAPPERIPTFTTGCSLLDCVTGGWALGRVINIVGDTSTGKTLLAEEALRNYLDKFPNAQLVYAEGEAAFDSNYAESIGLPVKRVLFPEIRTTEDFISDVWARWKKAKKGSHTCYVLDSLDSISDVEEMNREMGKGSFGTQKPKLLSQFFRRFAKVISQKDFTLIIVSQVRDKIGVMFGKKESRSGGRALDFFASQIVWLHHIGRIHATRHGIKRVVGVRIRAMTEKNRVIAPFRDCEFPVWFGFGTDDVAGGIEWLVKVKRHGVLFSSVKEAKKVAKASRTMPGPLWKSWRKKVRKAVRKAWATIERDFAPTKRKYT